MNLEILSCCTSFELEAEMHDRASEAFIYILQIPLTKAGDIFISKLRSYNRGS